MLRDIRELADERDAYAAELRRRGRDVRRIDVQTEGLGRMAVEPIEVVDSPELPPLWQVFGGHRRADGHWALPELADEGADDRVITVGSYVFEAHR